MSALETLGQGQDDLSALDAILNNKESETPTDSSPVNDPIDQPPSSGEQSFEDKTDVTKTDRLADNPRFREVIREKNSYKEQAEEANRKLEETTRKLEELNRAPQEPQNSFIPPVYSPSNEQAQVPNEFVNLFGQDPALYQSFNQVVSAVVGQQITQREQARLAIEAKEAEKKRLEQEIIKTYEQKNEMEISELSKKNGVDKNEFRAWFSEAPILNKDGNSYNFERGMELFKATQKKKSSRRDLGEESDNHSNDASDKILTIEEMNKIPWNRIGK